MREEKLSYKETECIFGLPHRRAASWERIYMEEACILNVVDAKAK